MNNSEKAKQWRLKNPDKVKEYNKKRDNKYFEDMKQWIKQWRFNNKDKIDEYKKKRITNYFEGKIYKIICNITKEQYYGSTKKKYLSMRLAGHRRDATDFDKGIGAKTSSYDIIKRGDYYIDLVELFPCNSRNELETRERYYIENNTCVNKKIPTRTRKERKKKEKIICEKCDKEFYKGHLKRHQTGKNCI
jgi:hypothetical protein